MPQEIQNSGVATPPAQSNPPTESNSSQTPPSNDAPSETPEFNPESILESYDQYITTGSGDAPELPNVEQDGSPAQSQSQAQPQSQPGSTPVTRGLNSKRKFDGLDDNEKRLFNDMSTPAYEYLYPKYLKSREQEQEIERLRAEQSQLKETSFYDQEGAWKLTPEYEQLSTNLSYLQWEQQFWEKQLGAIEDALSLPLEEQKGAMIPVLDHYDQQGNPVITELPASRQLRAKILSQLNLAQTHIVDHNNKIQNLSAGFKDKHKSYLNNLKEVRSKMFAGYPTDKLSAHAQKKLEAFPPFTRSRPEVQMLAEAWVLFDALIYSLKKSKANGISNTIRGNTSANSGPAGGSSSAGAVPGKTVGSILEKFQQAGYLGKR